MTTDEFIGRVLASLPAGIPRRSAIAAELRSHIHERLERGATIETVLHQLGDPVALAASYVETEATVAASLPARALAKVIDAALIAVMIAPLLWLGSRSDSPDWAGALVIVALFGGAVGFGVYTAVAEAWWGQTVGKRVMHLRVVRESGTAIGFGQAIVRSLPMFLQVYAIDVLFAVFTDHRQRAFELLSKTRVIVDQATE